jgi:hypothetical protein
MSRADGWAAINLEMPDRVPRTEYSAEGHWALVSKVTGIPVTSGSSEAERRIASAAFKKAWSYDFIWNIRIHNQIFGDKRTTMGHAKYASGGVDFVTEVHALYEDPEDALKFDPWELYGAVDHQAEVAGFNSHYAQSCIDNPDSVNMTGIYTTCISGLIEIFGWDTLLCAAGIDADGFGDVTNRYCDWIMQYFKALADSDAPVVMIHDDIVWTGGAFIHPDWYRKYVFPNYKRMFAPLIESGKKIMYTSDGTFTEFIDDIAACGVNGFVMEPTTDMAYIAEKYGKTHSFIGNADTRILLYGSREEIEAEVKRCMDIGKKYPGFFMAVGNHIPANTPVENCLIYQDAYLRHSRR